MKIKCITNKTASLPHEILINYTISYEKFSLLEGKEYIVYAVGIYWGEYIWYCICDETYLFYPMWNPSPLFEITDNRMSRYWIFGTRENYYSNNNKNVPFLSFPEWVNDVSFYTELIDGNGSDPNAIIFKQYKERMDLEFPDNSIVDTAQIGDSEWLICPECIDAWQSVNNIDALVKCPKCNKIFNNPRYI